MFSLTLTPQEQDLVRKLDRLDRTVGLPLLLIGLVPFLLW